MLDEGLYMKLIVPEYCLVVENARKNSFSTDFIFIIPIGSNSTLKTPEKCFKICSKLTIKTPI